jgi:glucokinase
MLLAGDIGGTKALLGLFSRAPLRPAPVAVESFPTPEYPNLVAIIDEFLRKQPAGRPPIEAACFGVAGPVIDDKADLVNVGWIVDGREVAVALGLGRVRLLNDLVAIAHSVSVLDHDELYVLQAGEPNPSGNAGLIAAGTGLGQAYLFSDGQRLAPAPSESGHADFAARTPRELELTAWLAARYGRAQVEAVVSGLGLANLYHFTHPVPCPGGESGVHLPALISQNAAGGRCAHCREALDVFIGAYGAEAGNLALRAVTTRGLYIGGGIAPRIIRQLEAGAFMQAFRDKSPMAEMMATIPVKVILNPQAGLLGAATAANAEAQRP